MRLAGTMMLSFVCLYISMSSSASQDGQQLKNFSNGLKDGVLHCLCEYKTEQLLLPSNTPIPVSPAETRKSRLECSAPRSASLQHSSFNLTGSSIRNTGQSEECTIKAKVTIIEWDIIFSVCCPICTEEYTGIMYVTVKFSAIKTFPNKPGAYLHLYKEYTLRMHCQIWILHLKFQTSRCRIWRWH